MKFWSLAILLLASAAFAAEEKKEEKTSVNTSNEVAVIKTTEGDMVVEFWNDAAPNTIENFKKLARSGFYNGIIFHRIVRGFMIQGGDPNTKDPGNEPSRERGVVWVARGPPPGSAGSQFFIGLGRQPRLDHQYTTFGKVIKGDDVLDKIGNTPVTRNNSGEMSKPTKRVTIEKIDIVP